MLAIIAAIENDFEREFITQIYLTYYKKMRGKALFIIKDEHEADEIVQEAFVKLIEHVQSLMKIDPIKVPVYVMVTVKHISFNHWNARKKEKENMVYVDDYDLDRWAVDENALPEEAYIHEEELERLADLLPKLPERERILLESKYILDLSDAEIAEELHIAPKSVRSYLTRARRKAYSMLEGENVDG